jgi:hypothetical protein
LGNNPEGELKHGAVRHAFWVFVTEDGQNLLIFRQDRNAHVAGRISGIGTFSGRAPLAPGGLPGFTGPFPSTSRDKATIQLLVKNVAISSQRVKSRPRQLARPSSNHTRCRQSLPSASPIYLERAPS